MGELPIFEAIAPLREALRTQSRVVLQAPPGSGKTTVVPLALLEEPWLANRRILMLEPRRIAAASAAHFMASKLEEEAGGRVGYRIRFEQAISKKTRIEVLTEGILTRRLQGDPELDGVGLVIFDEFHERHLEADLALALCLEAQQVLRPDLRLLVMSATLDAAPLCELLEGAPLVQTCGRSHPVEIHYLERKSELPQAQLAARCVEAVLPRTEGDLLVFLPGMKEILECRRLLESLPGAASFAIHPLHGSLSLAEQRRALLPGPRRKLVLATNVAESSLTIEGIRVVVDGGLCRRPRFDPACGLTRLVTGRISRASAEQRSGRAGRLGPGQCFRLWTAAEQGELLPHAVPEIRSADLGGLALQLARWGARDAQSLRWLDAPSPSGFEAARELLRLLGALDTEGRLTPLGEQMSRLPAPPRLARLLLAAGQMGCPRLGADLAALLEEAELLTRVSPREAPADPAEALAALRRWRKTGQGESLFAADRAARYFLGRLEAAGGKESPRPDALARLCALAYPDRLARRRQPGQGEYLLRSGRGARLSGPPGAGAPEFLVATGLGELSREQDRILSMLGASEPLIRELFADQIRQERSLCWDESSGRVEAFEQETLGALVLGRRRVAADPQEVRRAVLAGLRDRGAQALPWEDASRQLCARVRLAATHIPELDWPEMAPEQLMASLEDWLAPWLEGVKNRQDLARLPLLQALKARLSYEQQRCLEQEVPERMRVPSGSSIRIDYDCTGPPVLAVKLQELFGLAETPRIARGRVPLLLHLLSPARRPLQVTADLRNFWDSVYPQVKKELKGRYPRHPWPEDPWSAQATRHTKKRAGL